MTESFLLTASLWPTLTHPLKRFHLAVQCTARQENRKVHFFEDDFMTIHLALTLHGIKLRKKNYFLQPFMTLLKYLRSSLLSLRLRMIAFSLFLALKKSHHLLMMRQFIKRYHEGRVFLGSFMQMFISMSLSKEAKVFLLLRLCTEFNDIFLLSSFSLHQEDDKWLVIFLFVCLFVRTS